MHRARYTAEGGTYRVGGISFDPGDEYEVDHELAHYLSDHDDFDVSVEKADAGEGAHEGDDEADSADDQDDGDEFDAAGFVDRTPMDDVVEDIETGEVDEHLDAVQAAEEDGRDRVGVQDAIGQRRAELEG